MSRKRRNGQKWPKCSVVDCCRPAQYMEVPSPENRECAVFFCETCAEHIGGDGVVRLEEYKGMKPPGEFPTEEGAYAQFARLGEQGGEPLLLLMAYMISENAFKALEVVCQGNNWQYLAACVGAMFHGGQYAKNQIDLRVLKARGYDGLRSVVFHCVSDIRDKDCRLPDGYDRLVNRLFTSQGLPTP